MLRCIKLCIYGMQLPAPKLMLFCLSVWFGNRSDEFGKAWKLNVRDSGAVISRYLPAAAEKNHRKP
jgi:hypothetical protein